MAQQEFTDRMEKLRESKTVGELEARVKAETIIEKRIEQLLQYIALPSVKHSAEHFNAASKTLAELLEFRLKG
jgi:hypothetical protein